MKTPYDGKTPAIPRDRAEAWLQQQLSLEAKWGRPEKKEKAAEAYHKLFPQGHAAEGVGWKAAARAVGGQIGETVSTTTLKRGLGLKN